MIKHTFFKYFLTLTTIFIATMAFSQNKVKGIIKDGQTGETLIGANILLKNSIKGTITDFDGAFELDVSGSLPYTLIISSIGYESKEVEVTTANANLDIDLAIKSFLSSEVVVSASRIEEKLMQSPVTIEKLDLVSIKNSTTADYYDQILKLKGVTNNMASLTFNTINTRGFGGGGNTRFVQLQDGMDNASPLLNFPTGNVVGISELDIRSAELVPGAASALYGPNAFNGILIMQSKDPFQFQGLSASIKTGMTQGSNYSDPLFGGSIRYAKAFNNKFAFKLNFSGFQASDWRAQNYTEDRNLVAESARQVALGNAPINTIGNSGQAAFDGMNKYGDETFIPIGTGLRRSGWEEQTLLDNNDAKSFKYDAAAHYRINDNLETNVSYKYGLGSTVYQGAERYALRNFTQQFAKWELNSSKWNIRAYGSFTNAGDSYNMTALGAFTNENIWRSIYPSAFEIDLGPNGKINVPLQGGWAVAANIAQNLPGFNLASAKAFADAGGFSSVSAAEREGVAQILAGSTFRALGPAGILAGRRLIELASGPARPKVGSAELDRIIRKVRDTLYFQGGGAGFIDNSRMYHAEGNYNLSDLVNNAFTWQVGGNVRQYSLFSNGTIFNEDPDQNGTNERITINEYGMYTQVSKGFADDALKLTASLRYDKNQNFNGNVTPRVSAVYSFGENKQHNLRAAFQTGFRNPSTQGQFIFFPTTSILLGNTKENAEVFGLNNGNAYTQESYNAYRTLLATGGSPDAATALLKTIDFDYVQPERMRSIEVGYKGSIGTKLIIDGSAFYNVYSNFIDQVFVVNKNATTARANAFGSPDPLNPSIIRTVFFPYINVPTNISTQGAAVGLDYSVVKSYVLSGNYAWNKANKADAIALPGFADYDPGFNMPEHMFNASLSNRKLYKNLGASVSWRYQNEFFFKNSFGNGDVPAYNTVDLQFNYFVPAMKSAIKVGATNLFNKGYITNIGNPLIGRMVHLTLTYDQFAK